MAPDPVQEMIKKVNYIRGNHRLRHLRDPHQRRLNAMLQTQLPMEHQAGTEMSIPVLSRAEAVRLHQPREKNVYEEHSFKPPPQPSAATPNPFPVRQNKAPIIPFAGQPLIRHDTPHPRDSSETNAFLERAVQREPNDGFREVAFRIIDSSKLVLQNPHHADSILLHNPRTNKSLRMTSDEFTQAVAFISHTDFPPPEVVDVPPNSKTIKLLELMNNKPPGFFRRVMMRRTPDGIPLEEIDSWDFEKEYNAKVALQEKLNYLRQELKPTTSMPCVKTWLETLSLGLLNYREERDEGGVIPSIETVVSSAPVQWRKEARQMLTTLKDNNILVWDSKGRLRDPMNKTTIVNSNIYNIIKNLFDENSAYNQDHLSKYEPTGLIEVVNKYLSIDDGQVPDADRQQMYQNRANGRWSMRNCNARTYNLVTMFKTLARYLPYIIMLCGGMKGFVQLMLSCSNMTFSWFAYLYDWLTVMGVGNKETKAVIDLLEPVLNASRKFLPESWSDSLGNATMQTVMENQGEIKKGVWDIARNTIGTMAGLIATWGGGLLLWNRHAAARP